MILQQEADLDCYTCRRVRACTRKINFNYLNGRPLIYMSPRGKPLSRDMPKWAAGPGVIILRGRFEGIDERILESYDIEEISWVTS